MWRASPCKLAKGLLVTGVGEFVEVDDGFLQSSQPVENEICADKSGSSSYENHVKYFKRLGI
jgi:hypothetical protein